MVFGLKILVQKWSHFEQCSKIGCQGSWIYI